MSYGVLLIVVVLVFVWVFIGIKQLFNIFVNIHYNNIAKKMIFLQIKIPRKNSQDAIKNDTIQTMKQNIEIMHQIYKNFYGLISRKWIYMIRGQRYGCMEMLVEKELIKFIFAVPRGFRETYEKSISSFYPGAVVDEIPDPELLEAGKHADGGYVVLTKDEAFPIKSYEHFEADPMDSLLSAFSRVRRDEKLMYQILAQPLNENWQKNLRKKIKKIKEGGGFKKRINNIFFSSSAKEGPENDSGYSSTQINDIEKKAEDEGFDIVMRVLATSPDPQRPKKMVKDFMSSLNQYNYIGLNTFTYISQSHQSIFLKRCILRHYSRPFFHRKLRTITSQILNIRELSSLYHFPHARFNQNPRIKRQNFKIVPAPDTVPQEGILLGHNLYGGVKKEIRLQHTDRFRHFYIVGQTGTGKSTMLSVQAKQDAQEGRGFTLIDPHGDLCEFILQHYPKERIDDLIYFDAGETSMPIGINVLEANTPEEKELVTSDLVDMFVQMYGPEIFGPRIQDYFRNGVLTLMEQPEGGTLVEIMRLFVDEKFQKLKVRNVKDPTLRSRWQKTFENMGEREKAQIIPYFQAKFGPFTTTPLIRNIIGQVKSSFDIYDAMQQNKVILMNLSKGKMGEVNSKLLGTMMVTRIKAAALRRASIPEDQRKPYFLYIDEFQNYVTPSIETILSEARKYRLGLIIAHQYIEQLVQKSLGSSVDLKGPVFGNIGTQMAYKVGAPDADFLEKEFSPEFGTQDLINMDRFKGVIKLSVDTQPTRPFSLNVVNPYTAPLNPPAKVEIIKKISRLKRGAPKDKVEEEINFRILA